MGGSGGVGTSCLAAALATRAALRGGLVACADAAGSGGGIDALFDLESAPGARWPDLAGARGRLDGAAVLAHLPVSAGGVAVLAAVPTPPGEAAAGGSDVGAATVPVLVALAEAVHVLVVDLGCVFEGRPWLEPLLAACPDVVLVTGAGVPALARAAAAGAALEAAMGAAGGRAWLAQRCPRGRADLAELVAERLGMPLLAAVFDEPQLDDRLARGVPPGTARGRLAEAVEAMWRVLDAQERAA